MYIFLKIWMLEEEQNGGLKTRKKNTQHKWIHTYKFKRKFQILYNYVNVYVKNLHLNE